MSTHYSDQITPSQIAERLRRARERATERAAAERGSELHRTAFELGMLQAAIDGVLSDLEDGTL